MADAKKVIREALERFEKKKLQLLGPVARIALWFRGCGVKYDEDNIDLPIVFSIDEYDHFDEIDHFIQELSSRRGLKGYMLINQDVVDAAGGVLMNLSRWKNLTNETRRRCDVSAMRRMILLRSPILCRNYLIKTVPFNLFIENNGIEAIFQGLRWDEHVSRANDEYFTYREPSDLSPARCALIESFISLNETLAH